jgi:hypothetical protein
MAYIFKPYHSGLSFDGQISYGMTNIEISTDLIRYIDSIKLSTRGHLQLMDTGFERRVTQTDTPENRYFNFQIAGNCPKHLVENLRSLAKSINGGSIPLRFYDDFFTGQAATKIYKCTWVNAGDFVDNNILTSTAAISLFSWEII